MGFKWLRGRLEKKSKYFLVDVRKKIDFLGLPI
jgi:hypothetical protein